VSLVPPAVQLMIDDARRDPEAFWNRAAARASMVPHVGPRV
jgi:hypothetical protein